MAFDTLAVANFFIEKAIEEGRPLSPMKLQKLVFFAQGWHLAIRNRPLIAEPIEAWSYGPVIRSLYKKFSRVGNSSIKEPVSVDRITSDPQGTDRRSAWVPRIEGEHPEQQAALRLLNRIWEVYKSYSAVQLSNMTHEQGTPWAEVVKKYEGGKIPPRIDIPPDLIKEYFEERRQAGSGKA